ncbi:CtsR family transcriptional regulator [Natranaerofaba carboxydovora]|uniref:CtsR family transcriptional regulator n=1 Tax=Natranaerofaba carboxydovora TaxID=2742683 RepID=UPI001F132B62|nr:CtsR family transcriptional regulator [Natranaerofaba carboxydovora]UMZ75340.1 Transcriptional regulator CtsR [Natranaerofaba carboxydovora]
MGSLSNNIESYIKRKIEESPGNSVIIKRSSLAEKFNCVPSQINYVLSTRFTPEKGYVVKSRRGGSGYIQISRLKISDQELLFKFMNEIIGKSITQKEASDFIMGIYENKIITEREKDLLLACIHRQSIPISLPARDKIRAKLLTNALLEMLKFN